MRREKGHYLKKEGAETSAVEFAKIAQNLLNAIQANKHAGKKDISNVNALQPSHFYFMTG